MALTLAVGVVVAAPGVSAAAAGVRDAIRHHRSTGEYFGFAGGGFGDNQRDRAGLPLVSPGGKLFHNPTTIGQYGLWGYSKWVRTCSSGRLRAARRAADWLVRNQTAEGTWLYEFKWITSFGIMKPPWTSALAQGTAVALLGRIYHTTRQPVYLRAARRALVPLRRPLLEGGLRAQFGDEYWYAEYPIGGGTFELTGMMLTLIGLHDLAPRVSAARRLYRQGRQSLIRMLPVYDAGEGLSYYNLSHLTVGTQPVYEPAPYAYAHVRCLWLLDSFHGNERLRHFARKWGPPRRVTPRP